MPNPHSKEIRQALRLKAEPHLKVWTILDGARDEQIYRAYLGYSADRCCLSAGALPAELQMTAPYLVQLDRDDKFTRYLLDTGWGNSWGVFFRSDEVLERLRRHLRTFLRVTDESGRILVFRYYDPRVLRVYLPTCTAEELS